MARLRIDGLKELEKALQKNATMQDVQKIVSRNGGQLQNKMVKEADFEKGYQTGATKRSIVLELTDGGFSAEVGPETAHSPYLEYGTRFMEAQPFIKPAFDEQKGKFKSDLEKLVR